MLPTVYLQKRYRSGVRNFSDVPGKPIGRAADRTRGTEAPFKAVERGQDHLPATARTKGPEQAQSHEAQRSAH